MTDKKKEAVLRVAEAYYRDVGRGIARIDPEVMEKLGLQSGDVIEIIGKETVPAIVWPGYPEDRGKGIIRIDGSIRNNAGVGIGDRVRIRKVEAKPAEKIVLAPTEPVRLMGGEAYLLRLLEGRPVKRGQKIRVEVFGHVLTFVIVSTKPTGVVIVNRTTDIELKEKPVEEIKRNVPNVTYEDIGGLKRELRLVREMIELPLKHPELFQRLGIEPPKGVLLYGPPGTGKTLIAKAVANEVDAHFIPVSGPEIMSKYYGESEQRLREIFEEAKENAPSIIFFDEIDAIAPKREEVTGEVERRVVAQLLALMDGLEARGDVIVIGATNRPDAIDPALRRPGRFDREIEIGVPDREGRKEILQIHTRGMPIEPDYNKNDVLKVLRQMKEEGKNVDRFIEKVEKATSEEEIVNALKEDENIFNEVRNRLIDLMLEELADLTVGFVGADLAALAKEAAMHALRKRIESGEIDVEAEEIPEEVLENLKVTKEDFLEALKLIEPSAMREVLVEVPKVTWDDVGGLEHAKQELREAIEWPLKYPDIYRATGIKPPKGILLYGPPGTGKTLLAKAVANEANANFISVKGPELLSKWVGESITGDEIVLAKVNGKLKVLTAEELYNAWMNGEEIEIPCIRFESDEVVFSKLERVAKHVRRTPIYEIRTKTGRIVKVTADHSIFTIRNGEIVPIKTSELKKGDFVLIPQYIPELHEDTVEGVKINEDLALLIGLYIAEGSMNKGRVRIHTRDEEIIEKLNEICEKLGLEGKYYDDGSYHIKGLKFFEHFGVGAKNKRLGDALSLRRDLLAKVLQGYFSGDGSFYLKNHKRSAFIETVTTSRQLANELLVALQRFGIVANLKVRRNRCGNYEYRILIGRTEFIRIFAEEIGFIQKDKMVKINEFLMSRRWTRGKTDVPAELVNCSSVDVLSDRVALKLGYKVKALFFDRVSSIRKLNREDKFVYDLVEVVEGSNFIAGGIVVHNSERHVREMFRKAKQVAPCILFFDEIDALAPRRGMGADTHVTERVVSQLLTELDGIEELKDVFVIAATNRPDMIDPALLRPGRIERHIYIPPPDKEGRKEIFKIHLRGKPLAFEDEDVKKAVELLKSENKEFEKVKSVQDIEKLPDELRRKLEEKLRDVVCEWLAEKTEGYTGADIEAVCREAGMLAIREAIKPGMTKEEAKEIAGKIRITKKHLEKAIERIKPSLTKDDLKRYEDIMETFRKMYA